MESRFGTAPKQPRTEKPARRSAAFPLYRSKSRAAFVIRLIAAANVVLSLIIHIALYGTLANMMKPMQLPFGVLLVFILSFFVTLLIAWLINMMAEPFEHLRNCSDALVNIENMMSYQMEEKGIRFKEENY